MNYEEAFRQQAQLRSPQGMAWYLVLMGYTPRFAATYAAQALQANPSGDTIEPPELTPEQVATIETGGTVSSGGSGVAGGGGAGWSPEGIGGGTLTGGGSGGASFSEPVDPRAPTAGADDLLTPFSISDSVDPPQGESDNLGELYGEILNSDDPAGAVLDSQLNRAITKEELQDFMDGLNPLDPDYFDKIQAFIAGEYPSVGIPAQTETLRFLRDNPLQGYVSLYTLDDSTYQFLDLSEETIAEYNLMLADAGLLDPSLPFDRGWDVHSRSAMSIVMAHANDLGGTTWQFALDDLALANSRGLLPDEFSFEAPTGPPEFVRNVYRAVDYATIAQNAKSLMRQELGRDPKPYEIELLGDRFRADHRAAFEQEQAAAESEFNARIREQYGDEFDSFPNHPVGPSTVTAIDPVARMREEFEKVYAPEFGHLDRVEGVGHNIGNLMSSILGLDRNF